MYNGDLNTEHWINKLLLSGIQMYATQMVVWILDLILSGIQMAFECRTIRWLDNF